MKALPTSSNAYLRGLAFEARSGYSNDLVRKAIGFYERAVQLDPNFAIAWARLSRADAFFTSSAATPLPLVAMRPKELWIMRRNSSRTRPKL